MIRPASGVHRHGIHDPPPTMRPWRGVGMMIVLGLFLLVIAVVLFFALWVLLVRHTGSE
jgi:hypothetical protein